MTQEQRDAILTAALPALLAGAIYVFAAGRGISQEARAARTELEQAQRTAAAPDPSMATALATVAEMEKLAAERAHLEGILGAARAPAASRAAVSAWLVETLAENDVRLLEEVDGGVGASAPSWLRSPAPSGGAGLRTLSLEGRYLDVLAALEEIAAGDAPVIPVSLTMGPPAATTTRPMWRLVLWM